MKKSKFILIVCTLFFVTYVLIETKMISRLLQRDLFTAVYVLILTWLLMAITILAFFDRKIITGLFYMFIILTFAWSIFPSGLIASRLDPCYEVRSIYEMGKGPWVYEKNGRVCEGMSLGASVIYETKK